MPYVERLPLLGTELCLVPCNPQHNRQGRWEAEPPAERGVLRTDTSHAKAEPWREFRPEPGRTLIYSSERGTRLPYVGDTPPVKNSLQDQICPQGLSMNQLSFNKTGIGQDAYH